MPFKTFTSATLTAADVNDYLMEQSVITCTSSTRPSAVEGMVIYETDTETIRVYDGVSWKGVWRQPGTYTPTLTNMAVGTGGSANNEATFNFSGGILRCHGTIVFGTSGTTFPGSSIYVSPPSGFTIGNVYSVRQPVGWATFNDSGSFEYPGVAWTNSSTAVRLLALDAGSTYVRAAATGTTIPFTWVAGDSILWSFAVQATV